MATSMFHTNRRLRFFLLRLALAVLAVQTGMVLSGTVVGSSAATARAQAEYSTNLRVMSWNAFYLNQNSQAFHDALVELHPDLIAIQEISVPLVEELLTTMQSTYPYMELFPTGNSTGMAIVSRYPFVSTTLPDFSGSNGCSCQVVTIDIAGATITLINVHPTRPEIELVKPTRWLNLFGLNTANQDPIFDQLMSRIDQTAGPLLVMGDLNTMPFQPNVQRLQAILTDSFAAAGSGLGYTFPADGTVHNLPSQPFMRIDYIFHNAAWTTTEAAVGTIDGSDHCYVVADLILQYE